MPLTEDQIAKVNRQVKAALDIEFTMAKRGAKKQGNASETEVYDAIGAAVQKWAQENKPVKP